MKFFETDWNAILLWLGVWEKLSPGARRHYLQAKSHVESVNPEGYGADLDQALRQGLVIQVSTGRVKSTKASTPFRAVMVQLAKWPLFHGKPDRQKLNEYFAKHYSAEEERSIVSAWKKPDWDTRAWPASFLAARDIPAWEQPVLSYYETGGDGYGYRWSSPGPSRSRKTWFPTPEAAETAQFLVRRLLESQRAWPLRALAQEVPERLRPALDPAIKACLRHALLFAALDPRSLDLLVGVCPFILYLANRPVPAQPAVEPGAGAEGVPFRLEDMTQVLALAATDECLLNQGGYGRQFFKSVESRLQEEFVPLPQWLAGRTDFFRRLHAAAESLIQLRFATDTYRKESKRRLKATAAGRKWLAQSPADRLQELLFEYQRVWKHEDWEDEEEEDGNGYWTGSEDDEFEDLDDVDDLEEEEETNYSGRAKAHAVKKMDFLGWQKSVWRQGPTEGLAPFDAFLDFHARVSWPSSGNGTRQPAERKPEEAPASSEGNLAEEELCRGRLENFFWRVLVPFGCVQATQRDDKKLWFRLSAPGEYLVGLKKTLEYGQQPAAGAVLVQPNFEIVFLGPDLGAEVALATFAERCGRNVGILFRLTRQRIILAASRGITEQAVLATLVKYSSTPVPENVVAELKAWFSGCRSLAVRQSTLIQVKDAETAIRVQRLLGPRCTTLLATLLEWPEPGIAPKLATRLREQGLFLEKGPDGSEA